MWTGMDNLKITTATRPAWTDHSLAVVGGLMYVTLPTAIEAGFGVDLTGWKGFLTSVAANLLLGGVLLSPAYMAGTLGAAMAHLTYAKIQDPLFLKYLKKYAYRFDPTIVTSSMSDDAPLLPPGTVLRTVAGEQIAAFPPSPSAASVGIAQPTTMIQQPTAMNQQPMSTNQNVPPGTLTDGYGRTLSAPHLADQYTPKRARVRAHYNQPFNAGWTHGMT
ncbi:MAG: hypothetical protein BGO89_06850 [Candidatus Kapaibacterium thiocyanatum]|uniref:Uncharacterized protein n=1 Tax=Candidatus Kapaibacterium thiocyanatum TaxID=1895771 RepID=A0A1M3KYU8_9BACT|nr:MAG: hypothetical protein BGO89_06850 ['Candidatus Kapabacteria' thiocyanatum]